MRYDSYDEQWVVNRSGSGVSLHRVAYQTIAEVTDRPAHGLGDTRNRVNSDLPREHQERMYQPGTYTTHVTSQGYETFDRPPQCRSQ